MKKVLRHIVYSSCLGMILCSTQTILRAQPVLFSDDFNTDTSSNWTLTQGSGNGTPDYAVFFNFNYQTNKFVRNGVTNTIPAAPNGGGNGVKMYVNKNDAVADIAAVSLYPTGQVFSNDYALRFDMWLNYNGGFQGGTGSTESGTFGINHIGDKANWEIGTANSDGVWFSVTGEGGAALDYRSYVGDNATPFIRSQGATGGFLDRDGDNTFEEEVFLEPEDTYPLKQMFPRPQFETPGAPGKQWVQVEIRQRTNDSGGHIVTWLMNNYVIAAHANGDAVNMTKGNVMIGNMDIFSSIANPAADNYVIYDNVRVVDLSGVPTNPVVSVIATDNTATESPAGDNGVFTISRTGSTASPLTVTYRMMGSASNGVDYATLSGSVTIAAGDSSTNITVTPIDDNRGEGPENVVMVLLGSTNYDLYNNMSAAVTLQDDGDLPVATLTVFRRAAYEGNTNSPGQFRVEFSNPYINNVTVNYNLAGTAANGVNYNTLAGSVVMNAGDTNAFVNIVPIDDSSTVSNLTVALNLTTGANYNLGTTNTNGVVTIFNDDLPPGVTTLFSDNFDVDSSANWNVNASHTVCDAIFAFDYSTVGIPSAPHSTGGTTLGVKFRANSPALGAGVLSGISASPKNQIFTGDYRIRVDWWPNFPGPFPGGGAGSTQLGTVGVTRGTIAQWIGGAGTADAVYFGMTGDGGTSPDVRVYTNAGSPAQVSTGVFAAGTQASAFNEEDAYYAVFGRMPAPAAQLGVNSAQTGLTAVGAPGEVWHDVVVTKLGSALIWSVDGLRIATINAENFGINLSTNIMIGQSDINAGQTTLLLDNMQFGLFDNLKVESLALPTVTITNIAIVGANDVIDFTGGTLDPAVAYKVQQSPVITGPYTNNNAAVITSSSPGVFRATVGTGATNPGIRFYRIRR